MDTSCKILASRLRMAWLIFYSQLWNITHFQGSAARAQCKDCSKASNLEIQSPINFTNQSQRPHFTLSSTCIAAPVSLYHPIKPTQFSDRAYAACNITRISSTPTDPGCQKATSSPNPQRVPDTYTREKCASNLPSPSPRS